MSEQNLLEKQQLFKEITYQTKQCKIKNFSNNVYQALRDVPREKFVSASDQKNAYLNRPLAIGYQQTISQPFIVALMTDLLKTQSHHHILEIGTGSGYQAAVLSRLVKHVYSIEIIPSLAKKAQYILTKLGYNNITVLSADGYQGHIKYAPYDGIIVTAVTDKISSAWIEQLKLTGRIVLPIGEIAVGGLQNLVVVTKGLNGKILKKQVLPVQFVPLTRNA